ncbi:unnamed protein product [Lota lota]
MLPRVAPARTGPCGRTAPPGLGAARPASQARRPEHPGVCEAHAQERLPRCHGAADACGAGRGHQTLLLLAIKTTVQNARNRQTIRDTWGRAGWVVRPRGGTAGGYVRRVFCSGPTTARTTAWSGPGPLRAESRLHGDILQWDFRDSFFNLTLKDVLFWEWFSRAAAAGRASSSRGTTTSSSTRRLWWTTSPAAGGPGHGPAELHWLNAYPSYHPAFLHLLISPKTRKWNRVPTTEPLVVHKRMPDRVAHLWAQLRKDSLCAGT